MARFRCHCNEEGAFAYDGRHDCSNCGSTNVQIVEI